MKTLFAFAAVLTLTACGQTGPLRLPEPAPALSAPSAAAAAANDAAESTAEQPKSAPTP